LLSLPVDPRVALAVGQRGARFDFDGRFGSGTIVMLANVILLSAFTFRLPCAAQSRRRKPAVFSCGRGGDVRYGAWRGVTRLTMRHQT